jgi:hypothetical protein
MIILGWVAFALLYIIAIIALVLAGLAYQKANLPAAQKKALEELTDNVVFDGNVLVAAGFSDALPPVSSGTNFTVGGGSMLTENILATGQVSANVFVSAKGLNVLTGDISASESKLTCSSINTSLVNLKQTTKNISITPNLLTIGDTASLATLNLQASSLSFTNSNGRTTSMSANGVFVPNQNLIGLRYLANGIDNAINADTVYQLLAPSSAENVYGSLFVGSNELSLPATFEISFAGRFTNNSGAPATCKIALVNGSVFDDNQCFLGQIADISSSNLAVNPSGNAFQGKYTVTFLSFGLGATESFTTGEVSYGYNTSSSVVTTLNNAVGTINSTFGISFSLWAIWSVTSVNIDMVLDYLSLTQLISIPV